MSIQLRTSTVSVYPMSNTSNNGVTYRSANVLEPVSYNMEFSSDGGKNPKQLEALYDKCAEDGLEVELVIAQGVKKGRYNSAFVVFDVKPLVSTPLNTSKS